MLEKGNWKKADSFVWYGAPEDAEEYALYYTSNRDTADLIELSNEKVINDALDGLEGAIAEHHSHWACGYVDGWAVKFGSPAWDKLAELLAAMEDYPILDEEVYDELRQEQIDSAWDNWLRWDFCHKVEEQFGIDIDDMDTFKELFYSLLYEGETDFDDDSTGVTIDLDRFFKEHRDDIARFVKDITDPDKSPIELHENQPELFPVYSVALVSAVL